MTDSSRTGPLVGLRVVELAGLGPAPHAAMVLADLGADVVRIARPGDPALALGCRGAIDPGCAAGRRPQWTSRTQPAATRCCPWCAMLTTDRRLPPGVIERLGLGPEAASQRNPRLVFGRITGLGRAGPLCQRAGPRHQLHRPLRRAGPRWDAPASAPPPLNLVGDFGGGAMLLAFGVRCAPARPHDRAGPDRRRRHG